MDFWDIFLKEEKLANSMDLQILGETIINIDDLLDRKYEIISYTDFVDLEEIDSEDFTLVVAMLENYEKLKNKKLSPYAILLLYCFYNIICEDYNEAAKILSELFGFSSMKFGVNEDLISDFHNAVQIYSNFNNTDYLEELNFDAPIGKLFVVYGNQIIIYYLKKGNDEYGI